MVRVICVVSGMILVLMIGAVVVPAIADRHTRQILSISHIVEDEETGCQYLRGSSGSYVPRMIGYGLNYRHMGCRQ